MSERVKFPLWVKLSLFGTLGAVIPTLVVGFGLIDVNESTLKTQSREFRLAIAEDIAGNMDGALERSKVTMATISSVLTGTELSEDQRIELALRLVEGESFVDRVTIYGPEGDYIATITQGAQAPANGLEDRVKDATQNAGFLIGEPALDAGGNLRVPLYAPLKPDPKAELITGFMEASLSLEQIQKRVEIVAGSRLSGIGESGGSALSVVDSKGRVLAHSDPSKRLQPTSFDGLLGQDISTLVGAQVAYSGESSDRQRLVSAKPLENLPWITVVDIPLEEAYASVSRMRTIVSIVTIVAALLALIFAFLVARRVTRPIEALVGFTRTLAQRKFSERVNVKTSDEVALLAGGMNRAAEELQASEEAMAREIAIRNDLGRYLPKELVENVVRREQDMQLGGARREITVLFADVVRFTPLCEKMEPEQVVAILNELFTILTEIVFKYGGTIDKFLGDCVMAFWGAPNPIEDHAIKALEAAEEMQTWLEVGNARWKEAYGITVELAIGVNTGPAIIGNIGSETRMEYTAIGNAVNVAARLEALARPRQILTTAATRDAAGDIFDFGKTSTELLTQGGEPVDVYEVIL
ncbi:HAMP domain-containing protein [Microvenator marinus]|uniref:HAMP domain-containing protein n=1 Tax=Microvenator marinus TaxID=2600177 RepID=A0A5B8XT58_9DELT|nr:adenylate/guanylate cyclase domain-containing protein [Microvenator marinus]QED26826.1 HAMP domain-containing protein [Microvenator marinus]